MKNVLEIEEIDRIKLFLSKAEANLDKESEKGKYLNKQSTLNNSNLKINYSTFELRKNLMPNLDKISDSHLT